MNSELYNDWAEKRIFAMDYRMDKIRKCRKKRTNLLLKVIIPFSCTFIVIGAFTFGQFFTLAYMICCFIIAVVLSFLMYLDDKDKKKLLKILNAWCDTTDIRMLPPSIRDTFNS